MVGVVDRVDPPRTLHLRSSDGTAVVEIAKRAALWRDHRVGLGAFAVGDWIVAEGQWAGNVFQAASLASMLSLMEGEVVGKGPRGLETSAGTMRFTPDTEPHEGGGLRRKALDDLAVGDPIVALGRHDPRLDVFIALRVGVRTSDYRLAPPAG